MSLPLLGSKGERLLNLPLLFPLQLADNVGGIGRLEPSVCEAEPLSNEVELGGEHVLLLDELTKGIVVLAVTRDVSDDAQVVGFDCGIAKLLKLGRPRRILWVLFEQNAI